MATKPKSKKKEPGFPHYARAIQNDIAALSTAMQAGFRSIREDMATKVELGEVKMSLRDVRDDVKMITETMVSKADLENAIKDEFGKSQHARNIDELRGRVEHIESKLGIKRTRQAA